MSHYKTIQALGAPNVIHQGVIDMLDDFEMAAMLSHFMYWSDKTDNPLGVYRSNDELQALFKWSPAKIKRISDKLQDLGLITKTEKRLEHRIYYLFNVAKFDELYGEYLSRFANPQNSDSPISKTDFANRQNEDSPIAKMAIREQPKQRFGDSQNGDSLYTKITTEITTERDARENSQTENPVEENLTAIEVFEFLKKSSVFGSELGIIQHREPNISELNVLIAEVTGYWSDKYLGKQHLLAKILSSVSRKNAQSRIDTYTVPKQQPSIESPVTDWSNRQAGELITEFVAPLPIKGVVRD